MSSFCSAKSAVFDGDGKGVAFRLIGGAFQSKVNELTFGVVADLFC